MAKCKALTGSAVKGLRDEETDGQRRVTTEQVEGVHWTEISSLRYVGWEVVIFATSVVLRKRP